MVFWREIGWNEEDEAVDALEGVCNMTDMFRVWFTISIRTVVPTVARVARWIC